MVHETDVLLIGPIQAIKAVLPSSKNAMVTRDDVAAMADLGEIEGALEEAEETIIHNLLELRNVMVSDEMTPRTVVSAFEMTQTIKEVLDENTILRFPGYLFTKKTSTTCAVWLSVQKY